MESNSKSSIELQTFNIKDVKILNGVNRNKRGMTKMTEDIFHVTTGKNVQFYL